MEDNISGRKFLKNEIVDNAIKRRQVKKEIIERGPK